MKICWPGPTSDGFQVLLGLIFLLFNFQRKAGMGRENENIWERVPEPESKHAPDFKNIESNFLCESLFLFNFLHLYPIHIHEEWSKSKGQARIALLTLLGTRLLYIQDLGERTSRES